DHITNPVQRAIAELSPVFGQADTGPIQPPGLGVISGRDPRNGDTVFVNQIHIGISGGAGTPVSDGFLSIIHAGNAGMCYIDSVEVDELQFPIFIADRHILPDSEGAGTFRGAPSIYCEYGPLDTDELTVLYAADGTITPASGTLGGGPGGKIRAALRRANGEIEELPSCAAVTLRRGERIISHSAGGGGYGNPLKRDVERVLLDVMERWITLERARSVYGVALTGDPLEDTLTIDVEETARLRMKAS